MKRKLLTVIPTISLMLSPIVSLSCCSKTKTIYTQSVIDEFMGNDKLGINGITSCPRPTGKDGEHKAIIDYLSNRVKTITGLSDSDINVDENNNIYFDIPATEGYEDKDMIILQGHTDMVVAGLTEEEAKITPIDAVIDNGTIHSRDFKTSLGADNGAGIAIALTILKNRDNFNHGPLRYLLTADEDSGMIGAYKLSPEWLKYKGQFIKWLMNIDAEEEGYVYRSCAGDCRYDISNTYEKAQEDSLPNEYTLTIDGLLGGHSAIDIVKHRASADRMAFEFLYFLKDKNIDIQIVSHNHQRLVEGEIKEINYQPNQIVANSKLIFKTSSDESTIKSCWNEMVSQWKNGDKYNLDKWVDIEAKSSIKINTDQISQNFIGKEDSTKLIKAMGNYEADPTAETLDSLYYGVMEYNDMNQPKASANLGPVNIEFKKDESKFKYTSKATTRSSVGNSESQDTYSVNWLVSQYESLESKLDIQITPIEDTKYYPWVKDDNNRLVKLFVDGYRQLGVEPTIYDNLGGVEPSWWMAKTNDEITCACIGARIDGAHSVNETLYINTIEACTKNLIHAIITLSEEN